MDHCHDSSATVSSRNVEWEKRVSAAKRATGTERGQGVPVITRWSTAHCHDSSATVSSRNVEWEKRVSAAKRATGTERGQGVPASDGVGSPRGEAPRCNE